MSQCPCGSGSPLDACCGTVIADIRRARTAEQLMRARYVAYVNRNIDFLRESLDSEGRGNFDEDSVREWAEAATWKGFEVLSVEDGSENDDEGRVEFVVSYEVNDRLQQHHERSLFRREDGIWRFVDGRVFGADPYVREQPKVGRNDPCPCQSGKKYKKCCG